MFGAALDEDMTARHVCARTVDELAPMRGSKYVQSDLGGSFSQVKALLEEGTAVLFSGVPCQVDGLKRYLGKDYPNLLTCDLVRLAGCPPRRSSGLTWTAWGRPRLQGCLGALRGQVPRLVSPLVHRSVCRRGASAPGTSTAPAAWPGQMQLFLRPACARCRYTSTSRPADFTLADYWGLDEKLALPVERDKGVSMVLVNSARGQAVFDALSPVPARWAPG